MSAQRFYKFVNKNHKNDWITDKLYIFINHCLQYLHAFYQILKPLRPALLGVGQHNYLGSKCPPLLRVSTINYSSSISYLSRMISRIFVSDPNLYPYRSIGGRHVQFEIHSSCWKAGIERDTISNAQTNANAKGQ